VLSEEPEDAEIVEGPIPEATGYIVLKVRVGEHVFRGLACPLGIGADMTEDDLPAMDEVMRAVDRFIWKHQSEVLGWYREAARLRRLAGNRPLIGASPSWHVSVVGAPAPRGSFVLFRTQGAMKDLQVAVFTGSGAFDLCVYDDPDPASGTDSDAAMTAVLEYIFAYREQSTALGIDVDLLEELYG
jgi:hypothetical protein